MHTISLEDAKTHLPDLVKEVSAGGEVTITEQDIPVAKLVPATRAGYGSLRGQVKMADDFDAPLDAHG